MVIQITGHAVLTSIFNTEIAKYIGYIEISTGIGHFLGPTLGSAVWA